MGLEYLYSIGLDANDVETLKSNTDENTYSDLTLFEPLVSLNIKYMKDFGIKNYTDVLIKYPGIFLRDSESFQNIFSKFDKEDLIQKVAKNPAVFKKMVEFVDNN